MLKESVVPIHPAEQDETSFLSTLTDFRCFSSSECFCLSASLICGIHRA